jgi:hypothetical protein
MAKSNNLLGMNEDHVGGHFKWDVEPNCQCGQLKAAVDEERFVFVSNITDHGSNLFYIIPLTSDGTPARSDGIPIQHCPWCGDKIKGKKLYPKK